MPMTVQPDRDNIYRLELCGVLTTAELERCQGELLAEMDRIGLVKLLVVLEAFDGWEPGGRWNDLSFYIGHGDGIERIAIVGPERWRSETMMFAGADLRRAPVEFFTEDTVAEARAWLALSPRRGGDERT